MILTVMAVNGSDGSDSGDGSDDGDGSDESYAGEQKFRTTLPTRCIPAPPWRFFILYSVFSVRSM